MSLLYKTLAQLTNFRVCLYGSDQINAYFDCQPPALKEYMEDEKGVDNLINLEFV